MMGLEIWCILLENPTRFYKAYRRQQDAFNMIIIKMARILNGNADYVDNWTDIAGYATLVADRLEKDKNG